MTIILWKFPLCTTTRTVSGWESRQIFNIFASNSQIATVSLPMGFVIWWISSLYASSCLKRAFNWSSTSLSRENFTSDKNSFNILSRVINSHCPYDIKWGASSRWSSSFYWLTWNLDQMTTGKRLPSLPQLICNIYTQLKMLLVNLESLFT